MNKESILILFISLISIQVFSVERDTTRKEQEYYQYKYAPDRHFLIDTSLKNLEAYNFVQRKGLEYFNLGNLGLAHYPLFYKTPDDVMFHSGMDQFDLYRLKRDSIKYYNVNGPYVELSYLLGLANESLFRGRHSQRLTEHFDYGVHFHRISSKGHYKQQTTLGNNFSIYTRYRSPNKKYELLGNVIYNRMEADENGGVTEDIFDTSAAFISSSLIDVTLADARNDYREIQYAITNSWNTGYKISKAIDDTTTIKEFVPQFNYEYDLSISKTNNFFFDANPDRAFYQAFYTEEDSLQHRLRYTNIEQSVSFKSLGNFKKGQSVRLFNNQTKASLVHNNFELKQRGFESTFNNLAFRASSQSSPLVKSSFQYYFGGAYTFFGYNQNDFQLTARLSYDFNKYGKLLFDGGQMVNEPTWIAHRYASFGLNWENDFGKIRTFKASAGYELSKQKLAVNVQYLRVDNHIYWDTAGMPQQLGTGINGLVITLKKDFQFGHLFWTNLLVYQAYNNDKGVIRIPAYWSKHSIYYQDRIFNGVMLASFGMDVRYNTNFFANDYNPITGQFSLQNEMEMKYYPVLDLFLNVKVSTVRVTLKVNNVNQGLFQKGYYASTFYPTDTRSFRVGVSWRFYD